MSRPARLVVTAGPSIPAEEILRLAPDAEVVPPIRFGDAFRYGLTRGDRLAVVDGLFWQSASVRHRELLDLIDQGVEVYGSSSMGALRAAELSELGMVGHGQVFDAYRTGIVVGDDEVGMVHGLAEDGYAVGVDALVNVRATLREAVARQLISDDAAEAVLAAAATRCFTDRSWGSLLRAADAEVDRPSLLRWLRTRPVDVKRDDAAGLLRRIGAGADRQQIAGSAANAPAPRAAPGASGFSSGWAWNGVPLSLSAATETAASAGDVLELAAVRDLDFPEWRHRHLLRLLAAAELADPAPPGPGDRGRERPAGDLGAAATARPAGVPDPAWTAWTAAEAVLSGYADPDLDAVGAGALVRTGILSSPDSDLPAGIEGQWVYQAERELPAVERNALVATRSIGVDRNAVQHRALVVDLALQDRLTELAADVVRIREDFAEKAPTYTGALSAKGWEVVQDRLSRHWGEDYHQGIRRRGLRDLPELGIMFALSDLG